MAGLGLRVSSFFVAWLAPSPRAGRQRGLAAQLERREAEQAIRELVVELLEPLAEQGVPRVARARALGLSDSTLLEWERSVGTAPGALGRPAQRAAPERRDEVLHYLRAVGPQVGVPTLASLFPDLARRELEELKLRFRRLTLGEDHLEVQELEWVQVGAVWAMDFTQLEVAIDGVFPFLLSVRDLASGYQLMALPAPAQDAELVVVPALAHLFQVAGAPLVLKNDNGGPLVAEPVQRLLEVHQVVQLRSPPYTPEYNGACEAGIGQFKTHAHYLAAAQGGWTSDVAEAARQQGNRIVRASGQSAEDAWDARQPLAEDLRSRFRSSLRRLAGEEWTARGEPAILHPNDRDALDRLVTGRALVEHGLLRIRRRRIPLPKSASFRPVLS